MEGKVIAKAKGEASRASASSIRWLRLIPFYDRFSPVLLADYVESTSGTGIVHSAPAYGVDDYISCKSAGFTNDEILNPVQGNGEYAASLPLFGGLNVWKAKNKILDTIAVTGNLLSRGEVMHSYHALLAP